MAYWHLFLPSRRTHQPTVDRSRHTEIAVNVFGRQPHFVCVDSQFSADCMQFAEKSVPHSRTARQAAAPQEQRAEQKCEFEIFMNNKNMECEIKYGKKMANGFYVCLMWLVKQIDVHFHTCDSCNYACVHARAFVCNVHVFYVSCGSSPSPSKSIRRFRPSWCVHSRCTNLSHLYI